MFLMAYLAMVMLISAMRGFEGSQMFLNRIPPVTILPFLAIPMKSQVTRTVPGNLSVQMTSLIIFLDPSVITAHGDIPQILTPHLPLLLPHRLPCIESFHPFPTQRGTRLLFLNLVSSITIMVIWYLRDQVQGSEFHFCNLTVVVAVVIKLGG